MQKCKVIIEWNLNRLHGKESIDLQGHSRHHYFFEPSNNESQLTNYD